MRLRHSFLLLTFPYREVLPHLRSFKQQKLEEQRQRNAGETATRSKEEFRFVYFNIPKFLFGEMKPPNKGGEDAGGEGVLVLEDLSAKGFSITDSTLMTMDYEHMRVSTYVLNETR